MGTQYIITTLSNEDSIYISPWFNRNPDKHLS